MQVFKTFFAVVRKNIGLMCMYTGIFVGIAITMANVVPAEGGASFQETKTSVTVIDRDNSALSAAITNYLYGRQTAVPLEDDQSVLQDALYRRVTSYILFIPAGYEQAFLGQASPEMETAQVPDSYSGAYVDNQVESYVKTVRAYTQAGFGLEAALEAAQADNARAVPVALTQTVVQSRAGVYYFFQFLCYGMAMVMIFGLAPVLLAFSQKGLAARMNASALPLRKRNGQIGLGALVLALLCFVIYMLMAAIIYRDAMLATGALICMLNAFVFLIFSTALGLLIGMVSKNSNMVTAIANVVVLAMCFLGGVYVPKEVLGAGVQTAGKFLPTTWYMQVVDTATTTTEFTQQAMNTIWQGMGMQLIFAAALVSVALVVSKYRQRTA
ncbi:MAG: ABC transporter permease [Ruminococcaceae bacterium]|nr:ABC transporter permease [Oscillospiraceae bacterium]